MRILGILLLVIGLATGLGSACGGGGGSEVDLSDANSVMAAALRAVSPPGRVGHLTSEWWEGDERWAQETWVDADNGRFRTESRPGESGDEGSFTVIVGEKSRTATYQSDVESYPVRITAIDREDAVARSVGNLAYLGDEYLRSLAWADERRIVDENTAGRREVVVETERAIDGDWQAGTVVVATVELDKATLLPVRYHSRIVEPEGTETEAGSVPQLNWEAVSPDGLPDGFFSPDALFAAYSTGREKLAEASKQGLDPYWLGEKYEGAAAEELDLYLWGVDLEEAAGPRLHYSSEVLGDGGEIVIIREAPVGQGQLGPLGTTQGGLQTPNAGPITWTQVTVQGQPAVLYSRTDSLSPTYEVTYRWLVVTLGGTSIELYTVPVSEEGKETNPLNDDRAIVALAEALVPVPVEP